MQCVLNVIRKIQMQDEERYDVVTDVLQKHSDKLWDMSKNKEEWGMMDHIRMEQIDQIKQCIALWKRHLHQGSGTYSDIVSDGGMDPR